MVSRAVFHCDFGQGICRRRKGSIVLALTLPILSSGCDVQQIQQAGKSLQTQIEKAVTDVSTSLADDPGAEISGKTSQAANVRVQPATSSQAVGLAAAGRSLSIVGRRDNWYQVAFADGQQPGEGWIRADLIELSLHEAKPQPGIATQNINLREGPGDDATIIGSLSAAENLSILMVDQGWLKIKQGDKEGWASGQYVVAVLQAPSSPASPSKSATPGNAMAAALNTTRAATTSALASSMAPNALSQPATARQNNNADVSIFALQPNQSVIEIAGYTKAFAGVRCNRRKMDGSQV